MILTFRTHKHKMSLNIFNDYKMQVIPFYPHRTSRVYDTLHDDAYSTASTKFLINHRSDENHKIKHSHIFSHSQSYTLHTASQSRKLTVSYSYTHTILLHQNVTILQFHNLTILESHDLTILQSHNFTVLQFHNLTI